MTNHSSDIAATTDIGVPMRPHTRRHGMATWATRLLGCGAVGAVTVGAVLISGVPLVAAPSPLASFPHYPGSAQTIASWYTLNGQRTDALDLDTSASRDEVLAYYEEELTRKGWTADGSNASTATVRFHRTGQASARGTVALLEHGATTVIAVTYWS